MAKVGILFNGIPMLTDPIHHPGNTPGVPMVKESGELLADNCCCLSEPSFCCERPAPGSGLPNALPLTLTLTLTNVSGCACVDGQTIMLTWVPAESIWKGTGAEIDGSCQADTITWELACEDQLCTDFVLTNTASICVQQSIHANSGCTCDPLFLEFTFNLNGLGCCSVFPGSGSITATVTE